MDDSLGMRGLQRARDLDGILQQLGNRQSALFEPLRQRLAFQKLHDEIIDLALATDVMQRADVRMVERRDGFGLALQALAQAGRARHARGQNLQGDGAAQALVARAIHFAHAARA
jgi:hypothetical protein